MFGFVLSQAPLEACQDPAGGRLCRVRLALNTVLVFSYSAGADVCDVDEEEG